METASRAGGDPEVGCRPDRHPHALGARGSDKATRPRQVGPLPLACPIRIRGVGAVAPETNRARRAQLARRLSELRPSQRPRNGGAVDGEVDCSPDAHVVEGRKPRVEEEEDRRLFRMPVHARWVARLELLGSRAGT